MGCSVGEPVILFKETKDRQKGGDGDRRGDMRDRQTGRETQKGRYRSQEISAGKQKQ